MIAGMTTTVNENSAIYRIIFNHQIMIPHHQYAVNMCKALLNSGEADCDDLSDEQIEACAASST